MPTDDADADQRWLVDRSRIQLGRVGCKRARYREYHSGPTGYGIRRKAQSLPLVTGTAIHELLAGILKEHTAEKVDATAVAALIALQAGKYERRCERRGFLELPGVDEEAQAEVKRVVREQSALIQAMGWALHLAWIPALLEEWEPIWIEQELELPIDDQTILMSKPDLLLRRRIDSSLAQFEAKTVGGWMDLPGWRKQWEDSVQLTLQKMAIEHALKEPVSFAYVFAMDKGRRMAEKSTAIIKQFSPFLYAYHKEANPPFQEEDWRLRWEWIDENGASRRLGKGYQRTATFDYPFLGKPEGMSSIEYWMRSLPAEDILSQRQILGPYEFLSHSQQSIATSLKYDEAEWRAGLWAIYEAGEAAGWDESAPGFVEVLDRFAPQSWNCHMFGKDCQFLPVCRREPLWPHPDQDERFEGRRPHHQPELEQMISRGIEPPEDQDEEDEE